MLELLKPENQGALNQLMLTVASMIGLALAWMVYSLLKRIFAGVSFLANVAYASPFLVGIAGFGGIGFAIGDLASGPAPCQVQI